SNEGDLYSWGQNIFLQCGHPSNINNYNNTIDYPQKVIFHNGGDNNDLDKNCEKYLSPIDNKNNKIKIKSIYAGTHFSILEDTNNNIWSFGRNECYQLGRYTKCENNNNNNLIKQESLPDLCRKVPQ